MKRLTAERNLRSIIERLERRITEPEVVIKSVFLFGSMLTDKPNPGDIDLALEYRSNLFSEYPFYYAAKAVDKALVRLRKGMKRVSFHSLSEIYEFKYPCKQIWPIQ